RRRFCNDSRDHQAAPPARAEANQPRPLVRQISCFHSGVNLVSLASEEEGGTKALQQAHLEIFCGYPAADRVFERLRVQFAVARDGPGGRGLQPGRHGVRVETVRRYRAPASILPGYPFYPRGGPPHPLSRRSTIAVFLRPLR